MAQDIVQGLFGLTPEQVMAQRNQALAARAQAYGAADPLANAKAQMYQLGGKLPSMFGVVPEDVKRAQQMQQMGAGVNYRDPQSIYQAAQRASDAGNPEVATRLVQYGRQIEEEQAANKFKEAQAQQMIASSASKQDGRKTSWQEYESGGKKYKSLVDNDTGEVIKTIGVSSIVDSKPSKVGTSKGAYVDLDSAIKLAEQIKTHPGLSGATGINAIFPSAPESKYTSGNARKAEALIKEFGGTVKMLGMAMIRQGGSIGQMTEKEWPIVEQMVANIDPAAGEQFVKEQIDKVIEKIKEFKTTTDGMQSDVLSPVAPQSYVAPVSQTSGAVRAKKFNAQTGKWE